MLAENENKVKDGEVVPEIGELQVVEDDVRLNAKYHAELSKEKNGLHHYKERASVKHITMKYY